ncbi:MAG: KTSC domain-containing protein [Bacteroidales bacterium]|nr:KTSC domain-containing protein [Bacteroidales bacterium]
MSFSFKQKSNRKYVNSKIIYFIEYDDEVKQLKVGFNDGITGFFKDIPKELMAQFESAKSKGSFFYKNLYDAGYNYYLESA